MSTLNRGVVYSLVAVVCILLLGVLALLSVAYNRHRRLEDATVDLKRNIIQQENKITELQEQLQDCDTAQTKTLSGAAWKTLPAGPPKAEAEQDTLSGW